MILPSLGVLLVLGLIVVYSQHSKTPLPKPSTPSAQAAAQFLQSTNAVAPTISTATRAPSTVMSSTLLSSDQITNNYNPELSVPSTVQSGSPDTEVSQSPLQASVTNPNISIY